MDSTTPTATITRRDPYRDSCSNNTVYWNCRNGPFIGCCSHDPCHDGYCHDITDEVLHHMSQQNLNRQILNRRSDSTFITNSNIVSTVTITETTTTSATCTSTLPITQLQSVITSSSPFMSSTTPAPTFIPGLMPAISTNILDAADSTSDLSTAISQLPSPQSLSTTVTDISTTAAAILNPILTSPKLTSVPQASTTKSLPTNNSPTISSHTNPTSSPSATQSTLPIAPPVAGAKKSARAIAGITLGAIACVIILLLLAYCCISRARRRTSSRRDKKRRRGSRANEGIDVDVVIKVSGNDKDADLEPLTPMTPGGAKLEAQRGRMLHSGGITGFRALGMSAARETASSDTDGPHHEGERGFRAPGMTAVTSPLSVWGPPSYPSPPATRTSASEHPASHIGMALGSLAAGLVHPAYRHSQTSDTMRGPRLDTTSSTVSLSQDKPPTKAFASRFYEASLRSIGSNGSHRTSTGASINDTNGNTNRDPHKAEPWNDSPPSTSRKPRSQKTVSWDAGSDILSVLVPEPLNPNHAKTSNNDADGSREDTGRLGGHDGGEKEKPRFNETTSKWASIVSPLSMGIGRAFTTAASGIASVTSSPTSQEDGSDKNHMKSENDNGNEHEHETKNGGTVAMSTENEVTSPVDYGGLTRPVKRSVFRGFDELLGGDGRLRN